MRTIVTGASSGIGRALALELAGRGARLLITARRRERLDEVAAELQDRGGEEPLIAPGDLCDADLRRQLIETAQRQWGGLDALVNNAGIGALGPFAEADSDRLRKIMEVNFFAPVELIRVALPVLRVGNRPIIVNVGSVLGHRAMPLKSEYCASKFAMHGFSDALRAELAPQRIDVLLASPSTTRSEFFDNVIEKSDRVPKLGGGAAPRKVARQIVRAIRRGRHEVILSTGGNLLVWADRLMPGLVDRLVARFGQGK